MIMLYEMIYKNGNYRYTALEFKTYADAEKVMFLNRYLYENQSIKYEAYMLQK